MCLSNTKRSEYKTEQGPSLWPCWWEPAHNTRFRESHPTRVTQSCKRKQVTSRSTDGHLTWVLSYTGSSCDIFIQRIFFFQRLWLLLFKRAIVKNFAIKMTWGWPEDDLRMTQELSLARLHGDNISEVVPMSSQTLEDGFRSSLSSPCHPCHHPGHPHIILYVLRPLGMTSSYPLSCLLSPNLRDDLHKYTIAKGGSLKWSYLLNIFTKDVFKWIVNYFSDGTKANSWTMEEVHKKGTWHSESWL